MEIVIRGEAKEIADLVREIQDRREDSLLLGLSEIDPSKPKLSPDYRIEIKEC